MPEWQKHAEYFHKIIQGIKKQVWTQVHFYLLISKYTASMSGLTIG